MVIEVKPEQPWNADFPILVTLLGIVMEVKPEQPWNADFPILVTLLGIVIEVKPEQPWNAQFPICVIVSGIDIVTALHSSKASSPISVTRRSSPSNFTLGRIVKLPWLL